MTVNLDSDVISGSSDDGDGNGLIPDSAFYTSRKVGGTLVATVERADTSVSVVFEFRVNNCRNLVDDGVCS